MKTLSATVIDTTHLELAEPIPSTAGERLEILVRGAAGEDADWHRAARDNFLNAYDDQDSIYDEL